MGEPTRIGAACTLNEVMEHAGIARRFGVLVDALRRMGSTQVRNAATLGGNLCNASPAADSAPPLLVLGARVRLEGPDGARELPLDRFLLGPGKTALGPDEILTHVVLDSAPEGARAVFLRKERVHIDIAIASMAVLLQIEPDGRTCGLARVAAGAVAPVPTRLGDVEALLEGAEITDEVVARARSLAASSVAPISDLRASASYRRHLVGVLLERAIEAALSEGSR